MANPRRNSETQSLFSFTSLIFFLKKPLAFPFLLFVFLLLTWVSLRLQRTSSSSPHNQWSIDDDRKANLVRFPVSFPSHIFTDKRGWLLNPLSVALDASISGGAVSCASVHLGEIRPGGVRGNHRHHTCNETFLIWGARTKFRLENSEIPDTGYAEAIVGSDEVAVAASPSGQAHALVNLDPVRVSFFMGCQDSVINYTSSTTDYSVWKDL